MNLIGDPWIPVIFEDGQSSLTGLLDFFEKSSAIQDLTVNPPQRISLMRLLICIVQAALDGPEDEKEWLECQDKIVPESIKYLDEKSELFDLFGDQPFMQIKELKADKTVPLDKLDCCLASGNRSTLFDHEAIPSGRWKTSDLQTINLLTFLNFSTGGKIGQGIWRQNKYNHSTFQAPCIKSAHTFIRGRNILETIYFNLLTKKKIMSFPNGKWGNPVWEIFPKSPDDKGSFENAAETYMGRLVPLSRFINLSEGSETECIISPTFKKYIITHLPSFREPSTTVVISRQEKPYYLPVSSEKHIWRDLSSVLNLAVSNEQGGAVCLQNIRQGMEYFSDSHIDIWVGGLETGDSIAKLNDMVEWNLSLPMELFGETVLIIYQNGVTLAKQGEQALKSGVASYYSDQKVQSKETTGIKKKAAIFYWTFLDNNYQVLINLANEQQELDKWKKLLYSAMHEAYKQTCPHETPRQIQAFTKGKKKLFI